MLRPPLNARALWLAGEWLATNKLLDLQRSSGFYAGMKRAGALGRREGGPRFSFAQEVARMREYTAARALETRLAVVPPVGLWFGLLATSRHDASAWYLPAKAAEDGLCDAGVIQSDHSDVLWTAGRTFRTHREADALLAHFGVRDTRGAGLLVAIAEGADRGDA